MLLEVNFCFSGFDGAKWMILLLSLCSRSQGSEILKPVEEGKDTRGPIFNNQVAQLYVNVSCPDCFKINNFDSILTEEILVKKDGRYRGRQYVRKGDGLNQNLEIIVPLNPCKEYDLKIKLRFTEDDGGIGTLSKFSKYSRECCTEKHLGDFMMSSFDLVSIAFPLGVVIGLVILVLLLVQTKTVCKKRKAIQDEKSNMLII